MLGKFCARHFPRDEPVLLVAGDGDGHVVLAHRTVAERLAVHVDHERVADRAGGLAGRALQHAGSVDRDMTPRIRYHPKDVAASAGIVR